MKTRLVAVLLTSFLSCGAQDFSKLLQSRMWYVKGDLHRGETCILFPEKPSGCSAYANFYDGETDIYLLSCQARTGYSYELKENLMKLTYFIKLSNEEKGHDVILYYRLREIPFSGCIEARPTESDPLEVH